jgi:hypothetical protein
MNKLTWLAGATTLTILVASGDAKANVFSVDGTFTVPVSGLFEIVADGAQGGAGFFDGGGLGGEATGEFALTAGETLNVVVGAMGTGSVGALMGGGTGADGGGASSCRWRWWRWRRRPQRAWWSRRRNRRGPRQRSRRRN